MIAASKEFKKTIIETYRAYSAIQQSKTKWEASSDAELDALNVRHLRDIGFKETGSGWRFGEEPLNMGTPLPLPESMKQMQPKENGKIEVMIEVATTISDLKRLKIKGKTNLPTDTDLMIDVSCRGQGYSAGDKVSVRNGEFESSWFGDSKRSEGRLGDGKYTVEISTPTVQVLKQNVKSALGAQGRNMVGSLVKFDELLGNLVKFETAVIIE